MNQEQTFQVNLEHLSRAVRKATGRPGAVIHDWHFEKLTAGYDLYHTVYRCIGDAVDDGFVCSWALIVKIIRPNVRRLTPQGASYWKREFMAYQSGFLAHLPGGLTAPACYEAVIYDEDSVWLFLEDVLDDVDHAWQVKAYRQAASQLAAFNAAYLTGTELPEEEWLSKNWLKAYLNQASDSIEFLRENPKHPLVQLLFKNKLPVLLAIWNIKEQLLAILAKHPIVFCHHDAFINNLFIRKGQLVAIDWSYAGIGPLGAELASFLPPSFAMSEFPDVDIYQLENQCVQSYLDGLIRVGLTVKKRNIRQVYVITFLLRYTIAANIGEIFPYLLGIYNEGGLEATAHLLDPNAVHTRKGRYYNRMFLEALWRMGFQLVFKLMLNSLQYMLTGTHS